MTILKKTSSRKKSTSGLSHRAAHDPRSAALFVLYSIVYENADSQAALDKALSSSQLMPTDKRLCTELVYGVMRWYLRLNSAVLQRLQKPEKLPQEMVLALVMALYELVVLRIPAHATVNWAVTHIRNRFGAGLAGVANGVLRALQRDHAAFSDLKVQDGDTLQEHPGEASAEPGVLAHMFAMPLWIVELWLGQYGPEETLQLLRASQQTPPTGIRVNTSVMGWEGLRNEFLNFFGVIVQPEELLRLKGQLLEGHSGQTVYQVSDCCFSFSGSLPWILREPIKDGRVSRQSAASYEALFTFSPKEWLMPLWDVCAGRGGKSFALLEAGVPVELVSDPSSRRLEGFIPEFSRLRLDSSMDLPVLREGTAWDVSSSLDSSFKTILIDAPCSGLGTLARKPEIRLRRTLDDCAALVETQRRILEAAWERLSPGGSIMYLTCTRNKLENEWQIASFLQAHTDSSLEKEFHTPSDSPCREFFYGAQLQKK